MIRRNAWLRVAATLLLLAGCKKPATAPKPPPPAVTTVAAATMDVPIVRTFSATVQAVKTVKVIPQVTGYLQKRFFTEGDFLKEGDPLYLIDPRPFQADLAEAEAQLKSDQASADFFAKEAARYEQAEAKAATSVQMMQQAQASLAEAKAAVAKDQASVVAAKLNLAYTSITAPFDGRVQTTQKNVGALVTANTDVLTTFVQIDPVYAEFNMSRSEMFALQAQLGRDFLFAPGVRASLTLPDGKPHPDKGKIDFVASEVNPMTDSVLVRAVIPNDGGDGPDVNLVSGQYAKLNLYLAEQKGAVVIPSEALIETQAGPHVYVVGADNKVEARNVVPDRVYEQYQVIRSGLKPGEAVIVSGLQFVRDGMTVKPEPAATPAPSPTATPTPAS